MFGRIGKFSPKFKDFILQIKDGVVINKFESTLEAAIFLNNGVNTNGSSKISICLSKKKYNGRRFLTYKGFKWIFENEWIQNLANSGKPLTIKDEGNPDPSLIGRSNDYRKCRTKVRVNEQSRTQVSSKREGFKSNTFKI